MTAPNTFIAVLLVFCMIMISFNCTNDDTDFEAAQVMSSTASPITIPPSDYNLVSTWSEGEIPQGTCIGSSRLARNSLGGSSTEGSCPSSISYQDIVGQAILACEISIGTTIFYDRHFTESGTPAIWTVAQATDLCSQQGGSVIN